MTLLLTARLSLSLSQFTEEGEIVIRVERMTELQISEQQNRVHDAVQDNKPHANAPLLSGETVEVGSTVRGSRLERLNIDGTSLTSPRESCGSSGSSNGGSDVAGRTSPNSLQARSTVVVKGAAASTATFCSPLPPGAVGLRLHAETSTGAAGNVHSLSSTDALPFLSPRGVHADSELLHLVFSVSDTGIGIDSAHIHKLFSAFTQLDVSITREYGGRVEHSTQLCSTHTQQQ